MITFIIKYFFISVNALYIYTVLNHIDTDSADIILFSAVCTVYLTLLRFLMSVASPVSDVASTLYIPAIYICFILYCKSVFKMPFNVTIPTSVISHGMSCFFYYIGSTICIIPDIVLKNLPHYYTISFVISGILQITVSYAILSKKRLQSGINYIIHRDNYNLSLILSWLILSINYIIIIRKTVDTYLLYSIVYIVLAGIILIQWWHMQISNNYIRHTASRDISILDDKIRLLEKDNTRMSTIIHKDNKLIPAMISQLNKIILEASCDSTHSKDTPHSRLTCADAINLRIELEQIYAERQHALLKASPETAYFEPTSIHRLDCILGYICTLCHNADTTLKITHSKQALDSICSQLNPDELSTLIADLLENALNAVKSCSKRNILLSVSFLEHNSHASIDVYDNGNAFPVHVFRNIGKIPTTTHANTGGSGIGLMTVCKITASANASLRITHIKGNPDYSKKISIIFDNKCAITSDL